MSTRNRLTVAALALAAFASLPATLRAATPPPSKAEMEAATQLQVFLDRAQFGPGKIDGRYGGFTTKALALYRESQGQPAPAPDAKADSDPEKKSGAAPDTTGLDLKSIEPTFVSYTVTDADLKNVGKLPTKVPEQAKEKFLPYADAEEAIAEKFHCDKDFLRELNPAITAPLKAGDQLTVPNVEPFDINAIIEVAAREEADREAERDRKAENKGKKKSSPTPAPSPEASATPAPPPLTVAVDTETNMARVLEADKIVAAFPVTIGSKKTVSPIGDWKVVGMAKMPTFRWDEAMLKRGKRSSDFHMLPSGPNNPVGVMWIELNKSGIGLHGTAEPDSIGRSSSHGCIRFANWDIVRLAARLRSGVAVSIH